jgi:signal peptidase I
VSQLTELPLLILLAFVIAVIIKTFLVQAFFIPSGSMFPTLHVGDRVLVEKLSYRFGETERGDVVVFAQSVFGPTADLPWYLDARNFLRELLGLPTGSEQDYIKRVVAVGGDTVRYSGIPRRLVVNGQVVHESYLRARRDRFSPSLMSSDCRRLRMQAVAGGCRVPEGRVFVMGDNRSNSEDSRAIGPIKQTKVVGHAFVIIWPPGDIGGI